jgi:uncharacterized protein (DUF488 family)
VELFTIGHSNRAWVEFAALLEAHGIDAVADVRRYPASRRHPQFDRAQFERELPMLGVAYVWLGDDLGGMRDYDEHMRSAAFARGVARLLEFARSRRLAYLCAEKLPDHCHRNRLSDALVARGITVTHVIGKDEVRRHEATEAPGEDRQMDLF